MSPPSSCPTVSPKGLPEAGGVEEYVGRLFDRSALADSARLAALTVLPRKEAVAALTADPAVEFYAMFADTYRQRISPVLERPTGRWPASTALICADRWSSNLSGIFTRMPI